MANTSVLRDDIYTAAVRQMRQERHATLSDADLDAIESQITDDVPVYVLTLIRELRASRALVASLMEARR